VVGELADVRGPVATVVAGERSVGRQAMAGCLEALTRLAAAGVQVSALETTLLPKRLQQCLTQILRNTSFNSIYCLCHSCVVLFH
jgi:hypothetical protein